MTEVVQLSSTADEEQTNLGMPPVVSVVVPVTERPDNLVELYREFSAPLRELGRPFEFLFVAEPSFGELIGSLSPLALSGEPIRAFVGAQSLGEAALLKIGADRARAPIVVTLPAYRRVLPAALPTLIERVERGADLVVARRWPYRGSRINYVQNRAFHLLLRPLTQDTFHDVACGVRAMRRGVLKDLPLYGDFSRFLPVLAVLEGYSVEEVPTPQHPDDEPTRIYSPGIYLRRLIDVLGLFFIVRFTEKPLRFFGLLGSVLLGSGGALLSLLLVQRLGGQGIADRPLLLLGVLLAVMGVQAIALGLVGEIIVHLHASHRRSYRVIRDGARQPRDIEALRFGVTEEN